MVAVADIEMLQMIAGDQTLQSMIGDVIASFTTQKSTFDKIFRTFCEVVKFHDVQSGA